MREIDLAKHFVNYLSDKYELYFEGPNNVDIVAVSGPLIIAIEVKATLNFKVIEQAYVNTIYFHYSYIAVEKKKNRSFAEKICRDYGIGILYYHPFFVGEYKIEEVLKPKFNRSAKSVYIKGELRDYMKKSLPGASANNGTTITAFKITVDNMKQYIKRHPGCSLKDALKNIDHHYGNLSAARNSIYQWIRKGVIKEFYLDKGKLYLTKNL